MKNNNPDKISTSESIKLAIDLFRSAALHSTMPPNEIYEEFGRWPATAWELRQELLAGEKLSSCPKLPNKTKEAISEIVDAARRIPESTLNGLGIEDLIHPSWEDVRKASKKFLSIEQN